MTEKAKLSEADLCAAFIAEATKSGEWVAYPEHGFDILLVRKADGVQVGIEAKLALNAKVIAQILPHLSEHDAGGRGPDYRAVLVPSPKDGGLEPVCDALGVTVLKFSREDRAAWGNPREPRYRDRFWPDLPREHPKHLPRGWHQWAPLERIALPDYVPDVAAGASAPLALTEWKIRAIKLCVLLETRPITRADFKALKISPSRWTAPWPGWLVRAEDGRGYVRGPNLPDFERQHPRNYAEIRADREKWEPAFKPDVGTTALLPL